MRDVRAVDSFLRSGEGLATLEWVAIASSVIVVGVITLLQPKVTTAASSVGSKVVSSVNSNS